MKRKNFTNKNEIELVFNGDQFLHKNLELIYKAQDFIILQTYIFDVDIVTTPIIEALIDQAKKNIDIYILIDGFGSREFPPKKIEDLKTHGIQFKFFSPIFSRNLDHIGRRLHSKLLIIDGKDALVGGINLSQRFNSPENSEPWLDFSCHITGEEVYRMTLRNLSLYSKYFPLLLEKHLYNLKKYPFEGICNLRTNINDWMRLKNEIFQSYLKAIQHAQEQIIIIAPYFFPGKKFLKALARASKRGVRVDLIFSAESDHPIERWSSKYLYSWFLNKNIHIYEWGGSIVHGKMACVDNDWVTIGSYNHNFLSRFGNHELNIEARETSFASKVLYEINQVKEKSTLITLENWETNHPMKNKVLETLSYIFANILTIISMLLVIRKKEDKDINLME